MKKYILFFVFLFIAFVGNTQQNNQSVGYYYKGKKLNLPISYTKITVGVSSENFTENTRSKIATICNKKTTDVQNSSIPNQFIVDFGANENNVAIVSLKQLNTNPTVAFAFAGYLSSNNKVCTYGNEFVIKLKPDINFNTFQNLLTNQQCTIARQYKFDSKTFIVTAGKKLNYNGLEAANIFFESGLFEYAEPDMILHNGLNYTPSDPLYNLQWSLKNTGSVAQYSGIAGADMNLENAWNITMGNPNIKIAVIDEGVDLTHPDLAANLLQGFNCLTQTSNIGDGVNLGTARAHGTACAGIIGAITDTTQNAVNIGVTGVAPFCKMIPICIAASNGTFTSTSNIAGGFDYAWQNGADVLSNSWGGSSPSSIMDDAIYRAVSQGRGGKGSVVLFASGNGNSSVNYPASNPYVIAVGASSMCDQRKSPTSCDGETFWGSCYGTTLDIVAPGVKIATTDIQSTAGYNTTSGTGGDFFNTFNGTSSACPNAAGVAALILSLNSTYSYSQIKQILELSAVKMSGYTYAMSTNQPNGTWNNETGHGRVNAYNALLLAQSGVLCNVEIIANGATRFCTGGSVNLSVVNPVIGTTYQWKKDGSNLSVGNSVVANASGSYSVEATFANTCIAFSTSIAVTELSNAIPLVARAGNDITVCSGSGVLIGGDTTVASGGAPYLANNRIFGMNWFNNSFVRFSAENPETFDTIALNMLSVTEFNNSQFYTGGTFTPYGYYVITTSTNKLIKVDTATGTQTLIATVSPVNGSWSGLSWDKTTKKLYGISSFGSNSRLSVINVITGALESTVTVLVSRIYSISFDNNGRLFASRSDNSSATFDFIYEIDKTTGNAVALSNNLGTSIEFNQDGDYDPVNEKLYLTAITNFQRNGSPLLEVNTTTGSSTLLGAVGGFSEIDATAIAGYEYSYNWSPSIGLNSTTVATPLASPTTTTKYYLTVTDMCGNTATDSVVVNVVENGTWLGYTNSWHVASNWCGGVPTATTNVTIPANTANSPNISSGTYQIKSLVLDSATNLFLNNNCILNVSENITNNGSIQAQGKIQLNGTVAQTLFGNGLYNNLSLNNSNGILIDANVSNKVNIANQLEVNGLSTLTTNGNLVLKSSSIKTASIPTASSAGGYIIGNAIVERFIPGGFRKYRFLGHPFTTAVPISDITDEIDITGTITGSNLNSFTATGTNAPSAFSFAENLDDGSIAGWQAFTSGNSISSIQPNEGIRILVRGSKGQTNSLTGGSYTPDSVVIKTTGALRQGDFTQNLSFTDINKGWNLICNPYPSNLDWHNVTLNNVNNAVYTYRPSFNGGVYASYVNFSSTNGGSNVIESSSAFFVRTNASNPSLQFHEYDKTLATQPNTMFRNATQQHSKVQLSIQKDNVDEQDEIIVRFGVDPATDKFDTQFDAENLNGGIADLFALDNTSKRYSIYHGSELKPFEKYREIQLGAAVSTTGNFTIKGQLLKDFLHGYKVYLKDSYLNSLTQLNDSSAYHFTVNATGTISNRFSLIFSNQVIPKTITTVNIYVTPNPTTNIAEVYYVGLNQLESSSIELKDINGRKLQKFVIGKQTNGSVKFNCSALPSGLYVVELNNGSKKIIQKLIKQ